MKRRDKILEKVIDKDLVNELTRWYNYWYFYDDYDYLSEYYMDYFIKGMNKIPYKQTKLKGAYIDINSAYSLQKQRDIKIDKLISGYIDYKPTFGDIMKKTK